MAQSLEVAEKTNGGSIPGCIDGNPDLSCDDEIGAGRILEQAICEGGVPHMAGKQIKSTRGGEGVTANNNRDAESHSSIDIKDEEQPQSTDFVIQEPNNMELLEFSALMASALYATGIRAILLMPKYYSGTMLLLLAISLTCFFSVKLFYKKIPHQIANLATSLAIACNLSSVLLFAGFIFAKVWQ